MQSFLHVIFYEMVKFFLFIVEKFNFYWNDFEIIKALYASCVFLCCENGTSSCSMSDVFYVTFREVMMVGKTHQFQLRNYILEIVHHLFW